MKVTVVEYHSRPISVMGAVQKPLTFQAVGTVTLLDALARAEGLTERRRHRNSAHARRSSRADSGEAPDEGRRSGGELSYCTAAKRSACRKPARFSWSATCTSPAHFRCATPADESVLKMVALSEGLTALRRESSPTSTGATKRARSRKSRCELDKIMQRKAPDVALQADDLLLHPRQQDPARDDDRDRPHHQVRRVDRVRRSDLALNT